MAALHSTHGIVLHQIKYLSSSIIVQIYTEKFGRLAFIIKGVRGKNAKIRANLFQPLFLLDMEIYFKDSRNLQMVKEIKNIAPFSSIPYDIYKNSMAIFLAEVLFKTIKEEEPNKNLFDFLFNSIKLFDTLENKFLNFHLIFLLNLSKYLGFYPNNNFSEPLKYFDLMNGEFVANNSTHLYILNETLSFDFYKLLNISVNEQEDFVISNKTRNNLLATIIQYYSLHIASFKEVKSLEIFKQVFND
ncbi:MAG: DNA repair protein RecO [Bacteroidetes bacterium]|jgi:DNA repair protein RecO (recombination protein O)|nr:DNA repair protein RecO [Bacteroidota bacterium]